MKNFKLLFLAFALIFGFSLPAHAGKKKDNTYNYRYEVQCSAVALDGEYAVGVWSYSKSKKYDPSLAGKNAVHGVIFKGIAGKQGCPSQPALITDPSARETKADFFKKFFADGGDYAKYVISVSSTVDRVRMKGGWKFHSNVQVAKDQLRKDLEKAGIVRGLSSGF